MQQRSKWMLLLLGSMLALLALLQLPVVNRLRDSIWRSWIVVVARVSGITSFDVPDTTHFHRLMTENIRLKAELRDYEQLRKQIGSPAFDSFRTIPAAVFGRPIDTFRSQLLLGQGENAGVVRGAPVVVHGSHLIGFISHVQATTAVCQLLLHPSTTLAVEVADDAHETSAQGLIEGRRYTSLFLTTVPRDFPLKKGQPVLTLAKEKQLPYGLTIGTIADVHSDENAVYQEARLQLPYDVDTLRAVSILVP